MHMCVSVYVCVCVSVCVHGIIAVRLIMRLGGPLTRLLKHWVDTWHPLDSTSFGQRVIHGHIYAGP